MRRLIWGVAGRTYHNVGNLMPGLNSISDNNQDHGAYKWRNGQNVTYKYWAARGNNPANTAHKQDCAYVVSSKYL